MQTAIKFLISRTSRATALAGLLLMAACSHDDDPTPDSGAEHTLDEAQKAELDAYIGSAIDRFSIPGVAVALVRGRDVLYEGTFGIRGVSHPQPITPQTRFNIVSVTKSMTSLMTATLVDESKLDWDDRAIDILPEFRLSSPDSTQDVRLRHLLGHSSGLDRRDTSLFFEQQPPSVMLGSLSDIPIIAPLGQHYQYHNQGFASGGYLATLSTGVPYEDAALSRGFSQLLERRVFSPIGMPRTTLDIDVALADENHAWPHSYDGRARAIGETPIDLERFCSTTTPASAGWSDLRDMEAYASTQLSGVAPNGKRVVSKESLEETHRGQVTEVAGTRYAMGWHDVQDYVGMRAVWHDGDSLGFTAQVLLLPEANLGVVVLANRVVAQPFYQAAQRFMVETALGREHESDADELGIDRAVFGKLEDLAAVTSIVGREEAAAYIGQYGPQAKVEFNGNGFVLFNGMGEVPLVSLGAPGAFASGGIVNGRFTATFDMTTSPAHLNLDMLFSDEGTPQPYVLERTAD